MVQPGGEQPTRAVKWVKQDWLGLKNICFKRYFITTEQFEHKKVSI